jgi:hypothetical protein
LGNASRHELLALPARSLSAVREHLRDVQTTDRVAPMPGDSGLGELSLVPATEVWYVALLGKQPQQVQRPYAIEEIAKAAVDKNQCDRLDPEVRWYVGAEDGRPVDIRMLVLDTRSCTYEAAVDVANRLGGRASDESRRAGRQSPWESGQSSTVSIRPGNASSNARRPRTRAEPVSRNRRGRGSASTLSLIASSSSGTQFCVTTAG